MLTAASTSSTFSRRLIAAALVAASLAVGSIPAQAAVENKGEGVKLLKAELPTGTTIKDAECEVLARAVSRAVAAHKKAAPAILNAALYNGDLDDSLRREDRRACECVTRIVRAAVKAAPIEGSDLMEVAIAAYPDCSDALAGLFRGSDAIDAPVAGINNLVVGDTTNSGSIGAGFPGSPTFGGSNPSGGLALPTPSGVAVTAVANQ